MSSVDYNEIQAALTPEDIKTILARYDVRPVYEATNYIVFPTVCHNLTGGSPKLYYYKDSHLFKCYTECGDVFNIFALLVKINKLRGTPISFRDAAQQCGKQGITFLEGGKNKSVEEDINYLYNLLHAKPAEIKLPQLEDIILNRYIFDKNVLQIWVKEGISYETMQKYKIRYDPINNAIIIPNYDIDGRLIGVRGRFLAEDSEVKYKPIVYGKTLCSHPSSMSLYGIHLTKQAIAKTKTAIIFEAEKSVMMMDTIYGEKNCSVATLGKNLSSQQIKLLLQLGVQEVMLAYDADYTDYTSMDIKRKEYIRIASVLKTYFNVSVLMDLDFDKLGYKDSPIDKGQEIFEKLLTTRIYI